MSSEQSRKWMVVVVTVWVQAFTGTNFDFSAYSSALKQALGLSQASLNYLATASDLGKALGWSSGLALLYLPLPVVLLLSALFGLAAYAPQWLVLTGCISLPYFPVFMLCLLAGTSICWFNTVCFVLCLRNFSLNSPLALSLSVAFNGVSAALYSVFERAISSSTSFSSSSTYLLLNAILPVLVTIVAFPPILRKPANDPLSPSTNTALEDTRIFIVLHILAAITGIYLLLLSSTTSSSLGSWLILAGAVILLALPLVIPGVVIARRWAHSTIYSSFRIEPSDAGPLLSFLSQNDSGLFNSLVDGSNGMSADGEVSPLKRWTHFCRHFYHSVLCKNRIVMLGQEHSVLNLLSHIDFWLYYFAYFFCATIGLVYSNNLGQIAQSLYLESHLTMLVSVYSSCSFFGRLLSSAPDFFRRNLQFARTGWLAVAAVPMPVAFFILAYAHDETAVIAGTALVGLSSGFIFAAAVSVTSELFGPCSFGVNHNILITNIPIGSLLYGQIAALVYDANGEALQDAGTVMCMGIKCYKQTFLIWGWISLVGLGLTVSLYMRTRKAYAHVMRLWMAAVGISRSSG